MGDALCRLFAFAGHDVTREFYVNDFGSQMTKFGQSLTAPLRPAPGPRDAGARRGLSRRLPARGGPTELIDEVGDRYRGTPSRATAPDVARVPAGRWSTRSSRGAATRSSAGSASRSSDCACRSTCGRGDLALRRRPGPPRLRRRGRQAPCASSTATACALRRRRARCWLRTTDYGDYKDRVLDPHRPARPPTSPRDIAYHLEKFARGFDKVIDIWGPTTTVTSRA